MELEKKDLKKLHGMYQDMCNEVYAYEALVETLKEKTYQETLKKIISERKNHLKILSKLTQEELSAKDDDEKYLKRLIRIFGEKRMFKHLSGIMEERAKESRKLAEKVPELKIIATAENKYQASFLRLSKLEKA